MTSNIIKESIELLKDLVSIESFSFNENKTAKRIEKWFQFHEIKYTRLKNIFIFCYISFILVWGSSAH